MNKVLKPVDPSLRTSTLKVKRSIRSKLLFTTLSLIFSVLITFTGIQLFLQKNIAQEELQSRIALIKEHLIQQGKSLSKLLVVQIENEIAAYNFSQINSLIDNTIKESVTLQYGILTDLEGIAYVHTEKPQLQQTTLISAPDLFAIQQQHATFKEYTDKQIIEYITPINFGKPWGVLRLGFSLQDLEKEITLSRQEINSRSQSILMTSVVIALVFILLASIIVLIISNTISKPLIRLTKFSQILGKGNFDAVIDAYHNDNKIDMHTEVGLLATSFIEMATEIKDSQKQLEKYNQTLEEKVQQRTEELLEAEKMAALGTLVAGVAHEINNPVNFVHLGAYNLTEVISKQKQFLLPLLEDETSIIDILTQQYQQLDSSLDNIKEGSERIKTIVDDLRTFSRLDEAERQEVDLIEGLKATIRITQTQYQKKVQIVTDFAVHPQLECWAAKLNQVFMNIIVNGCHAIEKQQQEANAPIPSKLIISSFKETQNGRAELAIRFQDSGCGMSEEIKNKIFEPFFTTKPVGQGTGLGMSISYRIIQDHQGRIEVESQLSQGTTITIYLPL